MVAILAAAVWVADEVVVEGQEVRVEVMLVGWWGVVETVEEVMGQQRLRPHTSLRME